MMKTPWTSTGARLRFTACFSGSAAGRGSGRVFGIFAAGLVWLASAQALAVVQPPPWRWAKGTFGASLATEYFASQANYDPDRGSYSRLIGDSNVSTWENQFRVRYGFKEWFSPYIGMGFSSIRAVFPTVEKTNSGVTDLHTGADFRVQTRWVRIFPQVEIGYPIDQTDPNQTVALTSEGVPWFRASVFFQKPMKYFAPYVHGGIRIPGEGLAKLLLFGAGAEIPIANLFVIGGGVEGYETVISDELSEAERERTTLSAMAGSHRFYAYNPALLEGRVWARFRPDPRFWVRAGYAKTIDGRRAAEGQSFTLSLIFNVPWEHLKDLSAFSWSPPAPKRKAKSKEEADVTGTSPNDADQDFDVEPEKTDPEIFDPSDQYEPTRSNPLNEAEKLLDSK